jgi:hypothetical protein
LPQAPEPFQSRVAAPAGFDGVAFPVGFVSAEARDAWIATEFAEGRTAFAVR